MIWGWARPRAWPRRCWADQASHGQGRRPMVNDGLFLLLALMTLLVMFLYAVITLSPEDAIRTEPPVLNPPAPPPPSPGSRWPHTPRSQLPRPGLWGSRTRPPVLTWVSTGSLVFVDETAEDRLAPDPLLGEVGDGVVGPRRVQLAAMGSSPVVMAGRTRSGRCAGGVR
jgi:hypothetical protein